MTQIVGFVGKKQSGKDTSCNFLLAMKLAELNVCDVSRINDDGEVEVSDILGEKDPSLEWIPLKPPHVDVDGLFDSELGQFLRIYALAGTLKDMAIQILGLSPEQAYGTDIDKNTLTELLWENMPGIIIFPLGQDAAVLHGSAVVCVLAIGLGGRSGLAAHRLLDVDILKLRSVLRPHSSLPP